MNQNSIGAEAVGNAVLQTSIGSWITKISALFSSLIIFRLLDPATYGIWRIALSLTALLLGGLTALGSVIAIEAIRSMNDTEKTGLILWRGFVRVTLLIAGILLTIGIIFADRLAHLLKIQDARLIILAFFLMVFWLIKVHAFSWFSIMYQFQNQLYIQIVESLLYLALLIFFLVMRHDGAWGLGLANVVTAGGIAGAMAPILFVKMRQCPNTSFRQEIRALFRLFGQHGKWALATDVLKDYLDAGRIWLLAVFVGPTAVGLFGLAESLLGHVAGLLSFGPALTGLLPRLVQDTERLSRAIARAVRVGTLLSIGIFVLSSLGIWFILPFLFPKFVPAVALYLVLSAVILFIAFGAVLNALYPALRLQKVLCGLSSVRIIFSAVFLWILLPSLGVWAVALESLTGTLFFLLIRWLWIRSHLHLSLGLRDFVPQRSDVLEIKNFLQRKMKHFFLSSSV